MSMRVVELCGSVSEEKFKGQARGRRRFEVAGLPRLASWPVRREERGDRGRGRLVRGGRRAPSSTRRDGDEHDTSCERSALCRCLTASRARPTSTWSCGVSVGCARREVEREDGGENEAPGVEPHVPPPSPSPSLPHSQRITGHHRRQPPGDSKHPPLPWTPFHPPPSTPVPHAIAPALNIHRCAPGNLRCRIARLARLHAATTASTPLTRPRRLFTFLATFVLATATRIRVLVAATSLTGPLPFDAYLGIHRYRL